MNEMIERVAQAIMKSRESEQDSYAQARAAIEAMREPTEAMLAGHHRPTAKAVWWCMISKAVNETAFEVAA